MSYACLVFCGGFAVTSTALDEDRRSRTQPYKLLEHRESFSEVGEGLPLQSPLLPVDGAEPLPPNRVIFIILLIDALGTMLTSLCGGLIQTTPYIGYSTYKKLNAGRDYSWMFASLLFLLSVSGTMSYLSNSLPQPVLKPIFIVIALQVMVAAFRDDSRTKAAEEHNRYIPAITMALFPAIADLMVINGCANEQILLISKGFIITSVLWGQVTLNIVEKKRVQAAGCFLALSTLTFFGFIHSMDGEVYYDVWNHPTGTNGNVPYQCPYLATYTCIGYFVCAICSLVFLPGPLCADGVL